MVIRVDKSIYSKEVLLKTAYSFTEKAYIHLAHDEQNWLVSFTLKADNLMSPLEFENELIAQQLRISLLERNADIRKMTLARAFASTVIENEEATAESADETLKSIPVSGNDNILRDWFENDSV